MHEIGSCRRRGMESVGTYLSIWRDWRSQVGEAGFAVVGSWDAGPIDFELARFFGDADVFCSLQANGIDKGIGHVGERDGAPGNRSSTSLIGDRALIVSVFN